MLPRIVAVLLLCVSSGMFATLGHYQSEEHEGGAVDSQVTDSVLAAASADEVKETVVDIKGSDSPDGDEPKLLARLLKVDNPVADTPEVKIHVADGAPAEGPGGDTDRPAEDVKPPGEAIAQLQPSVEDGNEIKPIQTKQPLTSSLRQEEDNSWSLNSIRNSFQTMNGYVDSLVELVGGRNGVCEHRCRYGEPPQPRPGFQLPEPNGCSSSLVGYQVNAALDLGIPAMTQCCNQLDVCYDTCGKSKYDCDDMIRTCLHDICSDLKKSLGFVSQVKACESMADALYNTVWTLGCRPYMNSQRAACVCKGEERDEL